MCNKNSHGHDEIPISIIKDNIDILAEPIADFLNKCIEQCVFPDQYKIARVLPIFKKGSKLDAKNYRPISLLPVFSKIFEKVMKDRLVKHLIKHNIISYQQFGYQRSIGTIDAIDSLVDDVVSNLNNKRKVAGLFLDLSSAFDTVEHKILLDKLEHYGIRDRVFKLFSSYLQNRSQYVEIKSVESGHEKINKSKLVRVQKGVPQGSVLGPIFFIIFLNDLANYMYKIVPDIKMVIFADDTSAVMNDISVRDLENKVNHALSAFEHWFSTNNLKLNVEKTKCMLFKSTVRNNDSIKIASLGNKVEIVQNLRFLGIRIDALLSWKQELEAITNSLSSACYALRSLRDELTIAQLRNVYFALVESKLRYSIKLWGNSYKYNMDAAFVMQKRALRTILRIDQTESCREHFVKLKILPVPCLYILVLLSSFLKNLDKYETKEERETRVETRRKDLPNYLQPKLNVVKHSSKVQSVKLFNKLPLELKMINSPRIFKFKLNSFLLTKCYYSIEEFFSDKNNATV